jgi:hypothetical protein
MVLFIVRLLSNTAFRYFISFQIGLYCWPRGLQITFYITWLSMPVTSRANNRPHFLLHEVSAIWFQANAVFFNGPQVWPLAANAPRRTGPVTNASHVLLYGQQWREARTVSWTVCFFPDLLDTMINTRTICDSMNIEVEESPLPSNVPCRCTDWTKLIWAVIYRIKSDLRRTLLFA